jgi:hypothetical protein
VALVALLDTRDRLYEVWEVLELGPLVVGLADGDADFD